LNWNKRVRQIHRWTAITFTVTVIATFIALAQREPAVWVSYVPLLPLAVLLLTGLYLLMLPYAAKWRSARRTAHEM
jgi:ABC-type Na+ efflux pump permease subunit